MLMFYLFAVLMPVLVIPKYSVNHSYYFYFIYIGLSLSLEVLYLLLIKIKIKYSINAFHFIKLYGGQVSRMDLFTDVGFVIFLYMNDIYILAIPSTIVLILTQCYPLFLMMYVPWTRKNVFNP